MARFAPSIDQVRLACLALSQLDRRVTGGPMLSQLLQQFRELHHLRGESPSILARQPSCAGLARPASPEPGQWALRVPQMGSPDATG
jgi:hypothetical protein